MVALIVAAGLALSGQPALAQADPQATNDPIVITGQRLKEVLKGFVNSMTQIGPTDQIAHWDREICPRILGLDGNQTEYVFQRMRRIAAEVRVKTSKRGCPTMLTIVVGQDVGTIARVIADEFPTDNIKVRDWLRKFVAAPGPVRWISLVNECGGGCGPLPNSRLEKATRSRLQAMIILVDSARLKGVSIGQLADYLSLVALTNPPVDAPQDGRSILGLFNADGGAAAELTNVDLGLLTSLYDIREEFGAERQRGSMIERMAKQLRRENDSPAPR